MLQITYTYFSIIKSLNVHVLAMVVFKVDQSLVEADLSLSPVVVLPASHLRHFVASSPCSVETLVSLLSRPAIPLLLALSFDTVPALHLSLLKSADEVMPSSDHYAHPSLLPSRPSVL